MGRLAWVAYFLFLVFYAWWKYQAAAPDVFSVGYAQSVAILVGLTGVAPFIATLLILKAAPLSRIPAGAVGVVLGVLGAVAGYALFWKLYISPYGGPEMMDVALRGIGWGALQGAIAAVAAKF